MNSRHHVLFAIRCLHERSIKQVVKTLLHTLFYGAAVFLNLSYDVAHASSIRILEDSVRIVMESKNQKTREERYDLSLQHFDALSKIQKYADKAQKKRIAQYRLFSIITPKMIKERQRIIRCLITVYDT